MDKRIVVLLTILYLAMQIVGIATPYWSSKSVAGNKIHMGLWQACSSPQGSPSSCIDTPPDGDANFPKNSTYACRAFAIIGAVLLFGAATCFLFGPFTQNHKCAYLMLMGGGLSSIVASIIWAADLLKMKNSDGSQVKLDPGFSWYLTLVSGSLAFILGTYSLCLMEKFNSMAQMSFY